jgi:hypothetical protein
MWRAWVVWCTRTYSGTEGWVELDLVGWDWRGGESSCTSSSLVMLPLRVPPPGAQRTCRSTYRCSLLLLPQPAGAVCPAGQVWQVGTLGAGVDESGGGGDRSLWLPPFPCGAPARRAGGGPAGTGDLTALRSQVGVHRSGGASLVGSSRLSGILARSVEPWGC